MKTLCYYRLCHYRQQCQRPGRVRVELMRHLCYYRLYYYGLQSHRQGRVRVERRRVFLRGTRLEALRPLSVCLSVTYMFGHDA